MYKCSSSYTYTFFQPISLLDDPLLSEVKSFGKWHSKSILKHHYNVKNNKFFLKVNEFKA